MCAAVREQYKSLRLLARPINCTSIGSPGLYGFVPSARSTCSSGTSPSDLYPMSTITSLSVIFRTWPFSTSPCEKAGQDG